MAFPDAVDPTQPSPLEQLQVAFAVHVAREIVAADALYDADEVRLLTRLFPDALLRGCRFVDGAAALTPAFARAYTESLRVLPLALDEQQKLDLVTLFHRACVADGQAHPSELDVLVQAADRLAIASDALRAHLRALERAVRSDGHR